MQTYPKIGYLEDELKPFYLCDNKNTNFTYHYHDFHKILIFLGGNASYCIEGRTYSLMPNDIIYIRAGQIHKPIIHDNNPYERMIFYISPKLFESNEEGLNALAYCFLKAEEARTNLLRIDKMEYSKLHQIIEELKLSFANNDFASSFYQKTLFYQLLIWLNRAIYGGNMSYTTESISNPLVIDMLSYMNENLDKELTIDMIANHFYLNRSYIMHLFKSETGYTIGTYITEKRLFIGKKCILDGMSITDACFHSGFSNYACFYRAFKEKFGVSPKQAKTLRMINP